MPTDRRRFHLVRLTGTLCAAVELCDQMQRRPALSGETDFARGLREGAALAGGLIARMIDDLTGGQLPRYRAQYWTLNPRRFTVVKGKSKPRK